MLNEFGIGFFGGIVFCAATFLGGAEYAKFIFPDEGFTETAGFFIFWDSSHTMMFGL